MKEDIYSFSAAGEGEMLIPQLTGISYCDGSYRIERKKSGLSCIEYILSGRGTVILDGKEYTAEAGDTYFLPEGHDHLYYADPAEPWEKIWLNFSGPLARSLAATYAVENTCLFRGLYTGDLLRSILRVASEKREQGSLAVSLLLHEVFHRMHHAHGESVRDPIAVALRDFIDQHCEESISAADLAEVTGKSPSQCCRIFRRAYGMPPYRYLLERRVALAKNMLEGTGLTVAEISRRLAFCDEYYFSNLFKEKVGVSPAVYRAGARAK